MPGLLAGLIFAFFTQRLIFAAPGAVHIFGRYLSHREDGIIALGGTYSNVLLALLFLSIGTFSNSSILSLIASSGFKVNMFLAIFNLIPSAPLDGQKVFFWNPVMWATAIGIAVLILLFGPELLCSLPGALNCVQG